MLMFIESQSPKPIKVSGQNRLQRTNAGKRKSRNARREEIVKKKPNQVGKERAERNKKRMGIGTGKKRNSSGWEPRRSKKALFDRTNRYSEKNIIWEMCIQAVFFGATDVSVTTRLANVLNGVERAVSKLGVRICSRRTADEDRRILGRVFRWDSDEDVGVSVEARANIGNGGGAAESFEFGGGEFFEFAERASKFD
jgi:hypothetical protein